MDQRMIEYLMSTATSISNNLDVAPHSWRDQLQAIRSITTSLELPPTVPDQAHRRWQLPLISVFQRVAFADADNGAIQDIADWCLRQALIMLQVCPEDAELLALTKAHTVSLGGDPQTEPLLRQNNDSILQTTLKQEDCYLRQLNASSVQ
ncbi:hypothetical protein N0V83_003814 [Neocucurbitaria cava]|uniref:Uncharacterized protein n=1 Tax=Neocucurbitaria cava TaxID=798079 RepID=A0A9W8Y9K3_9PLEO|nr:hypothetical protein N0V83_003814 [Neocucurbitaria cava]